MPGNNHDHTLVHGSPPRRHQSRALWTRVAYLGLPPCLIHSESKSMAATNNIMTSLSWCVFSFSAWITPSGRRSKHISCHPRGPFGGARVSPPCLTPHPTHGFHDGSFLGRELERHIGQIGLAVQLGGKR
ncbi:unnamed protein product, partial [Ectocarpus sp. 12 AP-2014]